MADVPQLLKRVTFSYQRKVAAKAAVWAVLGVGVLGAFSWRLQSAGVAPRWSFGIPGVLGLMGSVGVVWWLRRRWLAYPQSAVFLDQAMGLQERLTTAAEFAEAPQPPTLFPVLVEDAERRFSTGQVRLPRPLDHTAGVLTVALLLLLLWPSPTHVLSRMGRQPIAPASGQRPAEPTQEPQPPQDQHQSPYDQAPGGGSSQQDRRSQSSAFQDGEFEEPRHGAEDSGRSQPERDGDSAQSRTEQMHRQGQSAEGTGQQTPTGQGQPNQQRQMGQSPSNEPSQGREGQRTADQGRDPGGRRGTAMPQDTSNASSTTGHQSGDVSPQTTQAAPPQGSGQFQADPLRPTDANDISQDSSQQASSRGTAGGTGNQEALKAEIQRLLKEVSGELKTLQQQLAAAQVKTPEAGTSTDPELYDGSPTLPEQAAGERIAIPLKTDVEDTKSQRPGGGVGQPAGEVSAASPQMTPAVVQLSETPREEQPMSRQPIPPVYQNIFDRLQTPQSTPEEAR